MSVSVNQPAAFVEMKNFIKSKTSHHSPNGFMTDSNVLIVI